MKGSVKWFSKEKGYGFILAEDGSKDLFFHVSEYKSHEQIENGTSVSFEIGEGKGGKRAARNVCYLASPRKSTGSKPYYAKPTKRKGDFVPKNNAATLAGIVAGMPFGIIGGVIGGLIGSGGFERAEGELITSECLRCGGTGHVTNINEHFIGFQCEKCKNFWKKRNKTGLRKSDLEP